MADQIGLLIDGAEYGGWKTARVTISMEAGSGSFDLQVSEKWPGQPSRREIRVGQRCEVRIGRDVLITGYVDEVSISLDAESHSVGIRGRDVTADLIDCAPNIGDGPSDVKGMWLNVTLLELARELSRPFGIEVRVDPAASAAVGKRLEVVTISPGQRIFDVIEEKCRTCSVLPITDGRGALLLARAATARVPTPLVEGQNVLSASATYSAQDRFAEYFVKGQSFDLGTRGETAGEAQGYAKDAGITRHRPLMQTAENAVDLDECSQRARWEALTRAARGTRIQLEVQGLRQPGGALWPVNALSAVRCPTLGINGDLLVVEVSYSLPSSITTLQLTRPDAFLPPPEEVPKDELGLEGDVGVP